MSSPQQRRVVRQSSIVSQVQSQYGEKESSNLQFMRYLWDNGSLCVLIGATVFTFGNLIAKIVSQTIPPFQITFCRCLLSLLFTEGIVFGLNMPNKLGSKEKRPLLFAQGVAGAVATSGFYYAIQQLSLGEAVTINFLNPVFVVPLCVIFFKDYIGWHSVVGIMAAVFGVVFIQKPSFIFTSEKQIWNANRLIGIIAAFIGAFSVALMFILVRMAGRKENCLVITSYFYFIGTIMSFFLLIFGVPDYFKPINAKEAALLFAQAALSFVAQVFTNHGFQVGRSGVVASVNYIQVFFSYILDILIFHNMPDLYGLLGSVLIAAGVILVNQERELAREKKIQVVQQEAEDDLAQENDLETPLIQSDNQRIDIQSYRLQDRLDSVDFQHTPAQTFSYH